MDKREAITSANLGPVVSVLTWIIQAAVAVAVGIKFTLSSIIPGKRNLEDIPLFVATAFGIGLTITVSLAVPNGVGRHEEGLSPIQLELLQKTIYASGILFILVMACVLASVLILYHDLTPKLVYKRAVYVMAVFVTLVSIAFLFVAIFPCRAPRVWALLGAGCIDQILYWKVVTEQN
ncbi:hypothetical protein GGR57DRAFT_509013 [Xylariaceae sp. FL1272]|nr:hypothetical protein GGR57DRAFT_509013 [Xylariaceae sp. FL1272]